MIFSVRVSYAINDSTGSSTGFYRYPLRLVSTATTWGFGPTVSFREQTRRLRQSLQELRLTPPTVRTYGQWPARGRGRHGFQQAYRLPGYRKKRPA